MIKAELFVLSDRAIRDSESGNTSIINIIEDVTAESFPIYIPRLTVTAFLSKDNDDVDKPTLRLKIFNNTNVLIDNPIKVDFRGRNKAKAQVTIQGLPIDEHGTLKAEMFQEEKSVAEYLVHLFLRDQVQVNQDFPE